MRIRRSYNKMHSLNFQLQAVVLTVASASLLVFGVLFRILSEIRDETALLTQAMELNTHMEDWKNEINIGARSRIKYVTLRKKIFLTNYQNSHRRITGISMDIQDLASKLGPEVSKSLEELWQRQSNYHSLSLAFEIEEENSDVLENQLDHLKRQEEGLKQGIETFIREDMADYRDHKLASIESIIASSTNLVFSMAVGFVLINIIIWLLLRRKVLAPLKVLEMGAKKIGEGELGLQIHVSSRGEIRDLVEVLNKMSTQLKKNREAQAMLQKLETISQVAISVNHEINNPLQIIMGNTEYLTKLLENQDEVVNKRLKSILTEVRRISEVTQKLKDIRNPVVDAYVSDEETMIDLKRSS